MEREIIYGTEELNSLTPYVAVNLSIQVNLLSVYWVVQPLEVVMSLSPKTHI